MSVNERAELAEVRAAQRRLARIGLWWIAMLAAIGSLLAALIAWHVAHGGCGGGA